MHRKPTVLSIAQVGTPSEIRDVADLFREYTAWAFTLTADSPEVPPTFEGFEAELATLPGIYAPPTGCLLLATVDGGPAGCIALKGHDRETAELKRLYVRPAYRGQAIGQHLMAALIDKARREGYRRIVLDSHISMTKAHEIYMSAGFRKVATPVDFPEALRPVVVFMELDVSPARG
jgi:putative acetyltransferase